VNLRPYQSAALDAVAAGWKDCQRQLMVCPTGTGKTVIFAHLAAREAAQGHRVMILAHREELLVQAQDKIRRAVGLDTGLERADSQAHDSLWPVTVASVQTLHAKRLVRWAKEAVDLIVVDEAHHVLADSYARIFEHFSRARVLGVTATPDRGDKKNLGIFFDKVCYEYGLREAIADGYLCPLVAKLIPLNISLEGVRTVAGDYNAADVDERIAPYLAAAAKAIAENASDRKTLVFLPLVRTSEQFAGLCRENGMRAIHVDGASRDRAEILAGYADSKYDLLSNSCLLLEGYDCPDISCVVVLSPTKSRPRYAQMVGRGTRIAPGKRDLLILDFLWQTSKHDLCVPASLFSKTQEDAEQVMKIVAEGGPGGGQMDLLEAESTAKEQRERKLAELLRMQKYKAGRCVNPLEFAFSIHDEEFADYEPTGRWEVAEASEKQLALLAKFGIDRAAISCKGHASKIIDRLIRRRQEGLCTVWQARFLAQRGIDPTMVSFERAKMLIDGLKRRTVYAVPPEEW